jgi:hypothetical protein
MVGPRSAARSGVQSGATAGARPGQRLAPLLPPFATAFSGDLGAVKGDRDFYSRAERHIGLEPGAPVVFLDDTPANVEVASAHGWTGIHFTKDGEWHQRISAALEGRPGDVTPA